MSSLFAAVNTVTCFGPIKRVLLTISSQTAREVLVQAPLHVKDGVPSALLVLIPGALLGPKDYAALLKALQDAQGTELNLWVATPSISWWLLFCMGFNAPSAWAEHSDAQILRAVEAARAAGFPLLGHPQGRMENVFVAMHSLSAAFYDSAPMKHCAGSIVLGSVLDGSICHGATAASAPRSLMHISGQLDGQSRLPRVAWAAATAAQLAAQLSLRRFATICPFAIVPGCNHAQFCNGVVNTQRGDVASDEPIERAVAAVADLIVAFVAANHPGASPQCSAPAVDRLASATAECFRLLTPFSEAAGRGSPVAALEGGASAGVSTAAFAYGAERLNTAQRAGGIVMHPGEMGVAERVAREAQRSMLALGMAAGASEGVRVAVTVHEHLDSFIYSQPTMRKSETASGAEEWVVMCHVHLSWECYQPGFASLRKPLSPFYSIKLRKGAAVMQDMGLEGGREGVVTGAEFNARHWEQALASAPQLFLDTFHKRGKPLLLSPDRDMTPGMRNPLEWVKAPPSLEAVEGGIALQSPCISTPLGGSQPSQAHKAPGPGGRRGLGAHYIKCVSPAWMHEWIMIEGLRH